MPDLLNIYDMADEKQVKAYMEKGFAEYLGASMGLMQAMGATQDFAGMYSDASAGPPEIYNGVEIKSYILPNINVLFAELPPEMEVVAPEQWNIYYAISGGKMLYAMAGNAQPVKNALDRMAGMGVGFDQGAGYAKLTGALTLKNNMFFALSPITAVKSLVQIFAQADPASLAWPKCFWRTFPKPTASVLPAKIGITALRESYLSRSAISRKSSLCSSVCREWRECSDSMVGFIEESPSGVVAVGRKK